ncbi:MULTISPECIES: carbohydrate ABC transporter permease [unclassified Enterococcus]|uniref:carbohydrate ABC transporter permease n=1 Tax=unclassified Enterococcus TaxID=2608891 RepID=UPI0013E9F020|nr:MULTISPECIES: carbohydrate ABC transporter permease [unclassified Enterococcus]
MKKNVRKAIQYAFILFLGLIMIYPVLWMISGSFKTDNEILSGSLNLIPQEFQWQNYADGWAGFAGISFFTFFKNSFIISATATAATVLSSTCIAYALSRIDFKGRRFWFIVMLVTMMIPTQVILIPQFIIYNQLNLVGTYIPLILPHFFGQAFFIYQIMQFMISIPKELDESAIIDGCSKYSVFTKIIFPLLKPAIITTIIIQFYWKWDDFMGPLIYLNRPRTYTVSIAIKLFADAGSSTTYASMFAMSTLSLLPVFLIFLFFNKYLVQGISTSGLKD